MKYTSGWSLSTGIIQLSPRGKKEPVLEYVTEPQNCAASYEENELFFHVRVKKCHPYKGEVDKIASNLIHCDFYAEKPNQKWLPAATKFSLLGEKIYLSPNPGSA